MQRDSRRWTRPLSDGGGRFKGGFFHGDEAVFYESPHGVEAVLPADFLAFEDATGVIADGHFMDGVAEAAHLGSDFGAELEAQAAEAHGAEYVHAKGFVGGGFVGNAGPDRAGWRRWDFLGETVRAKVVGIGRVDEAAEDACGLQVERGKAGINVF